MIAEIKNGNLVITTPLNEPTPSKTGKTQLVANERAITTVKVKGCPVQVQISAFIKPE